MRGKRSRHSADSSRSGLHRRLPSSSVSPKPPPPSPSSSPPPIRRLQPPGVGPPPDPPSPTTAAAGSTVFCRLGRNIVEPPPTVRSTSAGRPAVASRPTTTVVPPIKINTALRTPSPIPPVAVEPPVDRSSRQKRLDTGHLNSRESAPQREASALQDELDMLQEENESVLEKVQVITGQGNDAYQIEGDKKEFFHVWE